MSLFPLAAQHGVHADGWMRCTAKLIFFVTLEFIRFVGESRPASRRSVTRAVQPISLFLKNSPCQETYGTSFLPDFILVACLWISKI